MRPTLSVLIASTGRPSLQRALDSVTRQLWHGDELLLDVNCDSPWGHRARNRMMSQAKGDYLMFLDDDDVWLPGARNVIAAGMKTEQAAIHMFRMQHQGRLLWRVPEVVCGNVSTQMFAVPRAIAMTLAATGARWGDRYEGDFDFVSSLATRLEVAWHTDVIAVHNQNAAHSVGVPVPIQDPEDDDGSELASLVADHVKRLGEQQ